MTTEEKKELREYLLFLADGGAYETLTCGICTAVSEVVGRNLYLFICKLAKDWQEHSGNRVFPVKHPKIKDPEDAYWMTANVWEGEYGAARRRLCRYIAEQL